MFYTFRQNNSGGKFTFNNEVTFLVIVEANSAEEANEKAEGIGLYFNGCDKGIDCPCCGDRWDKASEGKGDKIPTDNNNPVQKEANSRDRIDWERNNPYAYIHYKDGIKVAIRREK